MRSLLTLSSKGQLTLPAAFRKQLGLRQGDRLEATVSEDGDRITIVRVGGIEELSSRISGYAVDREPVEHVDEYYQRHRTGGRGE